MKMSKKDVAILVIVLGVGGYSYHASETGTGPIGWLDYAQRAIFGSYSETGSYLLALFLVFALAALALAVWKKVFKSRHRDKRGAGPRIPSGTRATPSAALAPRGRMVFLILIFFLAATWAIGFALYWSYATEQRKNASAQYTHIDLGDGAPVRQPLGSHIELRGGVPLDATLVHLVDKHDLDWQSNEFVPIASRGWVKGQAVTFVVKFAGRSEVPPTGAAARDHQAITGVIVAQIDGPVPGPVALEFKKIGVPLGEPNYLLRLVEARDAKAITKAVEERFRFFLVACGLLSAIFCIFAGIQWNLLPRRHPGGKGLAGR